MQDTKISAGTIARLVCLALALVNQALSAAGKPVLPIENATLESFITTALTVGTALWGYWKNNSFTKEAIEADEILKIKRRNARK